MKTIPLVIIFADRNPGPRRRLRVELRRRGAQVLLAGSTEEAIHQAAHDPPDILIMDDDLRKDGKTDLATFIHDAFPKAGIILLRGRGQPTSSPSGLDLLLWAHKRVADQTLIETIGFAFPGRLGRPTPSWRGTTQIRCVDENPSRLRSLTWFVSPRGYRPLGSRVRAGKAAMSCGILWTPLSESGDESIGTAHDPSGATEVQGERGVL
jgi:CheY-like chemotaxis protein